MSRTHAHYRRRRPRVKVATFTTFDRAIQLASECKCPMAVALGPIALVHKRHRHGCPAGARRVGGFES